jgi:hypothetical protein
MARQMSIQWACDTPTCSTVETNVESSMYGSGSPPKGWSLMNLQLIQDDCECDCHNYDCDDDGEEEPEHEEEDCPTCPPEGENGQICLCPKCTTQIQATYYKKRGALL